MKPTQAIIRQRVEEILAIRLDGAQFYDVRQYVAEKEAAGEPPWTIPEGGRPLSERSLWRYIEKTNKLLEESLREGRKESLRRHVAQRRHLYAKAVSQGDVRAALSVLRDEAELRGLYPSKGVELTGRGGAPIYPPLEAMVAAIIQAEAQNDPIPDDPGHRAGNPPAPPGSEALP
jgi:hypothetical protein